MRSGPPRSLDPLFAQRSRSTRGGRDAEPWSPIRPPDPVRGVWNSSSRRRRELPRQPETLGRSVGRWTGIQLRFLVQGEFGGPRTGDRRQRPSGCRRHTTAHGLPRSRPVLVYSTPPLLVVDEFEGQLGTDLVGVVLAAGVQRPADPSPAPRRRVAGQRLERQDVFVGRWPLRTSTSRRQSGSSPPTSSRRRLLGPDDPGPPAGDRPPGPAPAVHGSRELDEVSPRDAEEWISVASSGAT